MTLMTRLKENIGLARRVYKLPKMHLNLWGTGVSHDLYKVFTKRHPRFKIVAFKQIGVALLAMPDTLEKYLDGSERQYLRRMRNRAIREGYTCRRFNAMDRFDQIMDIHNSMGVRQGKPLEAIYLDANLVREFFVGRSACLGVFDKDDVLRGYFETDLIGDVWYLRRLIGHGDHLGKGIMYLVVSHLVDEMCANQREHGFPTWGMYDTYFGGTDGLRFFKDHLGFIPYNVTWSWTAERKPEPSR